MKKMMRFSFGVQAIDPIKDVVEQGGLERHELSQCL